MSYKQERFKVTLAEDKSVKKQYGATGESHDPAETVALTKGHLDIDFNDAQGGFSCISVYCKNGVFLWSFNTLLFEKVAYLF